MLYRKKYLLVGLGVALGGMCRYLCGLTVGKAISDPFAILVVNVLGCLCIGVLAALFRKERVSAQIKEFAITGFCGGLTTFSSFAAGIEGLLMIGKPAVAVSYVLLNMMLGLGAVFLGFTLIDREYMSLKHYH